MNLRAPDRLLRVDLSKESVERVSVPDEWRRRYVGGKGLGARYLYEELDADTDPLGPNNALLFMRGPVTGLLPGESRYAAITKSPLTGGFLDSYAGGTFPAVLAGVLRDAGGVLVTGRASEPVQLVVAAGDVNIEPAETWGADTVTTDEHFSDAAVACVGPAGENRVAYATVSSDAGDHHAGRGGAGAVMGAKRLKAVVAQGDPRRASRACANGRGTLSRIGHWQMAASERHRRNGRLRQRDRRPSDARMARRAVRGRGRHRHRRRPRTGARAGVPGRRRPRWVPVRD